MTSSIEAFGGDGPHEVFYKTDHGEQPVWFRRDLWFDRADGTNWIVWAQHRSWEHDNPPTEGDAEEVTLGSIVVTHPAVTAFLEQLGELLVNPVRFRHGPMFTEDGILSDPRV